MNLLLLSLGTGAVPGFIETRVQCPAEQVRLGYLNDAAAPFLDEDFIGSERDRLAELGYLLTDITAAGYATAAEFGEAIEGLDAIYVCGGSTFALLGALRRTGAGRVLTGAVTAGLPYIGSSAGSVIAGPSIEPVSLMDDPADAPGLSDYTGLGFIDTVVIPHADGALPPYPPELIEQVRRTYAASYPLTFLSDDQALLVANSTRRIISSP